MIEVLRMGHRAGRDERISTHVALAARQWGAGRVVFSGERDDSMVESVEDVVDRWGGNMETGYTDKPLELIEGFEGEVVHLTMYGLPLEERQQELQEALEDSDLLLVVGAEKVPREVYRLADHNIGVGNQPHSEIAALSVFLDRTGGIEREFEDANVVVEPSENDKITRES